VLGFVAAILINGFRNKNIKTNGNVALIEPRSTRP